MVAASVSGHTHIQEHVYELGIVAGGSCLSCCLTVFVFVCRVRVSVTEAGLKLCSLAVRSPIIPLTSR